MQPSARERCPVRFNLDEIIFYLNLIKFYVNLIKLQIYNSKAAWFGCNPRQENVAQSEEPIDVFK